MNRHTPAPIQRRLNLALALVAVLITVSTAGAADHATGSYSGNGGATQTIVTVPFQPDVLIIKSEDSDVAVIRTRTMTGSNSKPLVGSTALQTDMLLSLDPSGFTVGSNDAVNKSGVTFHWIAFREVAGIMKTGTYVGDNSGDRVISPLGFYPDLIIVLAEINEEAMHRTGASNQSFDFEAGAGQLNVLTTPVPADGFRVGSDSRVNEGGVTYHYICWPDIPGRQVFGSYIGDGNAGHDVQISGLRPEYVIVRSVSDGQDSVHHPESLGRMTDSSLYFSADAADSNLIQALLPAGIRLGLLDAVNKNGDFYAYMAWGTPTDTISGTVFEDVDGDGDLTDGVAASGVRVRIYEDANDDGLVDPADTFLEEQNTDGSGGFSFTVDTGANGTDYLVAVDSRTVPPNGGSPFNGGFGQGDVWAEQTYGDDPGTPALDLAARLGGRAAGTSDDVDPALTAPASNVYQHVARIDVNSGSVNGVNFGLSFNAISHVGDADDDTGANRTAQGSLRQAIQNANAIVGAATIAVPAGTYTLAIAGVEDACLAGDLDITDDLDINGAGAPSTTINANSLDRVFEIVNNATATLNGLTITGGANVVSGGGLSMSTGNTLTMVNSVLIGNDASQGGAIYNNRNLILNQVSVVSNTGGSGGGLFNSNSAIITNSLFRNNTVTNEGGGIWTSGSSTSLTLTNSTVSGNGADTGGGIFSGKLATLQNVTITGNTANTGGGVHQPNGSITTDLRSTIVANNSGGNCNKALTTSAGYNLESTTNTCGFTGTGDQNNVTAGNLNMGALADNGGPTQTHALLAGSFAIDSGTTTGAPAADQRGIGRGSDGDGTPNSPVTGDYDIGAYEFEPVADSCPIVTTIADSGPGSLRQCINYANSNPGTTITFNIPLPGNQVSAPDSWWRISPASALPPITANGTVIDGITQRTNQGDLNSRGPEIEIYGNNTISTGLQTSAASNCTLRDLVVTAFTTNGIWISGGSQNKIFGSYVGINAIGTAALGIGERGIYLTSTASNDIGGPNAGEGNVVSGNGSTWPNAGIYLLNATGTRIRGNKVGTNAAADAPIPNHYGIIHYNSGVSGTVIGGSGAGDGNVISGNTQYGVYVFGAQNTSIYGNWIGTDQSNLLNLANGSAGVGATSNFVGLTVGGIDAGQGNWIANNGQGGVTFISGATGDVTGNTFWNNTWYGITTSVSDTVIQNNVVRANENGIRLHPLATNPKVYHNTLHGNTGYGISVEGPGAIITNNIITGHGGYGIDRVAASMTEAYNLVTDATTAPANASGQSNVVLDCTDLNADPLFVNPASDDLTLQNASPAINRAVDLVADQPDMNGAGAGLYNGYAPDMGYWESSIASTCPVSNVADSGAASLRDCITYANANPGTTVSFGLSCPNQSSGGDSWWRISPAGALLPLSANGTVIDGTSQTAIDDRNSLGPEIEIYGNGIDADGIRITSGSCEVRGLLVNGFSASFRTAISVSGAAATNNTIAGNYVGTNYAGSAAVPNYYGVRILNAATSNTIGGTTAGDRNLVSGNSEIGIVVVSAGTSSNIIRGNYVGTDRLGSSNVGNKDGIELSGSTGNIVGGTDPSHRNVVSGNSGTGIDVGGASGNTISANFVGTTEDGMSPLGNFRGIWIGSGSQSNTIGGSNPGEGNLISGNNFLGLLIAHVSTSLNVVQGNLIGTDVTGIAPLPNNNEGIQLAFSAVNNKIGGIGTGEANTIAFNTGDGIWAQSVDTDGNQISANSIFSNGGLGIDLDPDGPGVGSGVHDDIAAPVITGATPSGADFDVVLTTGAGNTVELFRVNNGAAPAVAVDPSGSGEGFLYLGSCVDNGAVSGPHLAAGSDADGAGGTIEVTVLASGLSEGDALTATTTDPSTNTSEFALNMPVGLEISGTVYHDINANSNFDAGELGIGDAWVKLAQAGSVIQVVPADLDTGAYSLVNVVAGSYDVIVDDNNNAADSTPTAPVNWVFENPAAGLLAVTVAGADLTDRDFGLTFSFDLAADCVCGYEDGLFTQVPITIDGNMGDWGTVFSDGDNNACDATDDTDLDHPVQSTGRNLLRTAVTWDATYFAMWTQRVGSPTNTQNFVYYADTDVDGILQKGEPVVVAKWQGNTGNVTLELYTYDDLGSGGDPLLDAGGFADGYSMPGDLNFVKALTLPDGAGQGSMTGSTNGTQMEWKIEWTELGVAPGAAVGWHTSSTNSNPAASGLGAQVDDNLGGCGGQCVGTNQFAGVTPTPIGGGPGQTVYAAHTFTNTGNGSDLFDFTWSWTGDFAPASVIFYQDMGTIGQFDSGVDVLILDTDGDLDPDTGTIGPGASFDLLVAIELPPAVLSGSSTVTTTATSNFVPGCGGTVVPVSGSVDDPVTITHLISGVVFEDVNYGGGAGRDLATAAADAPSFAVGRGGVTIELYDASGNFLSSTTTAVVDGSYSFTGLTPASHTLRVVNSTVTSSRPGSDGSELAAQTYRIDGASEAAGDGARKVGGELPSNEDAAANSGAQTLASLQGTDLDTDSVTEWTQSIVTVDVSGGDATGVDFGFNFDVVVNTNDAGQGSLRQFILNSNLLQ